MGQGARGIRMQIQKNQRVGCYCCFSTEGQGPGSCSYITPYVGTPLLEALLSASRKYADCLCSTQLCACQNLNPNNWFGSHLLRVPWCCCRYKMTSWLFGLIVWFVSSALVSENSEKTTAHILNWPYISAASIYEILSIQSAFLVVSIADAHPMEGICQYNSGDWLVPTVYLQPLVVS